MDLAVNKRVRGTTLTLRSEAESMAIRAGAFKVIGQNVVPPETRAKANGAARFVADFTVPGIIFARTVRSTIPRGYVKEVGWQCPDSELVTIGHGEIPGRNVIPLIAEDQPCLAEREIRHCGEPIMLLGHPDRDTLDGVMVEIQYTELEPTLDYQRSETVLRSFEINQGSIERGFAVADRVIQGEYTTGHQEHLYLETNGVVAVPENGGITLYGSMQCPFYVHRAVKTVLALPGEKVRIVAMETGGGFGGKEDYPSMIAAHAALLAWKAQRPVKLIYERQEDLLVTTKRHPARIRHRTGVLRDGRLTAMEVEILLDGGAYTTLSPVVLSRAMIHCSGPYRCDNIQIRGKVVMTHTPPNSAFRGFGAPQVQFALESHMDRIAEALGLDPVRVREVNVLRPGDRTATGQIIGPDGGALEVLREAVKRSHFRQKRQRLRRANRGIGLALAFHGAGFTGAGEVLLASEVGLELTERGVEILSAATDMGQGARMGLRQIVAETLGMPIEAVTIAPADTSIVPDSGPTVASRTCMVIGGLLKECADEMRARLGSLSCRDYWRKHGAVRITKRYQLPLGSSWDEATHRGDAYATYSWVCVVAEVELDRATYETKVVKLTSVQDVGRTIHPVLAAGQVEGGSAQGLGYAILEQVVMHNGVMANPRLSDYLIPTTLDTSEIKVVFLNRPFSEGPYGVKGLGELPIDAPAPAILNALYNLGLDIRAIPATAERIMEALCASS